MQVKRTNQVQKIYGKRIFYRFSFYWLSGFPGCSVSKESAYNSGDLGLIPGWGRSPGEGNGNPLQYSCLGNPWREEPGELQSLGS